MTDVVEDDLTIEDDEGLLRRVPNWPNMVKFDSNLNSLRASSACFSDRETNDVEVSVTLEKPLQESGGNHYDVISSLPGFGLARLLVGFARSKEQIINKRPTGDDPHHGLIIGNKNKRTKTALAKNSVLVIKPKP